MPFINEIAMTMTASALGKEAEILRKSLQEVLYFIVGADPGLTVIETHERLMAFLRRHGTGGFLKRFLSLHVFNIVWFETGDSFRAVAWTQNSFLQDIDNVERVCRRLVSSIWTSLKISAPLDSKSALELLDRIGDRLSGR